jgi:hypothetical protein
VTIPAAFGIAGQPVHRSSGSQSYLLAAATCGMTYCGMYAGPGGALGYRSCGMDCSGTAPDGRRLEWDGLDAINCRDGQITRNAVYSSGHAPRVLGP